ncbi:MAG: hypothetical protein D6702_12310 [Planctomycetota bacterium]|nr:MAG: hypothetical protein D6702_12310 [Planctomycetota bacterium]
MGFLHRLLKGAEERDGTRDRSPDEARSDADGGEDLRALIHEIRLLREKIGELTGSTAPAGRGRRGGRGRGRKAEAQEREDERQPVRRGLPKEPPEDAPTGPLVDYLRSRNVVVYEGEDDLARNEAFEHLARHIGTHFKLVGPFYEKMKRAVASGHGQRIDIERWSEAERSAAVQLGTMLHRHGLLKDFYYHRSPKKQLRVIPTKDGSTAQFLTGGWLEIYVSWLLTKRLKARMSPAKYQVLFNVKGTLPNRKEFEADLMALVDGRMFWMECKTGNWQDYSARFKGLVQVFGCDRASAALLLIRPPDPGTRSRSTDMLDMSLISLEEVDGFINRFLGVTEENGGRRDGSAREEEVDRTAPLPVGVIPPLSEDEIPLENPEPARKLGRIPLEGTEETAGETPRRRRRRGRRGGRNRRRAETESAAADESRDQQKSLLEPVPVEPVEVPSEDAAEPDDQAASEPARSRRRRRRPSPFAVAPEGAEQVEATESAQASAVDEGEDPSEETATETATEGATEGRRRRRRRRRRRGGGGSGQEAAASAVEAAPSAEDEPLAEPPEAAESRSAAPAEAEIEVEPEALVDPEPPAEAEPEVQARADAGSAPESAAEAVAEADDRPEEVEEEPKEESLPLQPKKSVTGVTIAPDLAAMLAKPKEE